MTDSLLYSNVSILYYSCFDGNLSSAAVTYERWSDKDVGSSIATGVILLILTILGTFLNLFIAIIIIYNKLYKQPTHIIFLALVLTHLFASSTYLPMSIISALSVEFIFGNSDVVRCQVCQIGVISLIVLNLNIFLVALLSLDRFLYVRFPLHYSKYVTVKATIIAVVALTLFCTVISIPPLFGFGEIRFTRPINTCTLYLVGETPVTRNINYALFFLLINILGPGVILVVTNGWLACIVYQQLHKQHKIGKVSGSPDCETDVSNENRSKNKKKFPIVKLFGCLLALNIVIWIPNFINIGILISLDPEDNTDDSLYSVPNWFYVGCFLLYASNIFFSPFVQLFLIPDIYIIVIKSIRKRLRTRKLSLVTKSSQGVNLYSSKLPSE